MKLSTRRRRSIFDLMREYMEEFESYIDELFEETLERPSWNVTSSSLEPLCTVYVMDEEVVVRADLPYVRPETLEIEWVNENVIEIKAMMKRRLRFDDFGLRHRTGEFVCYRRRVRIPVPVETEKAKASFKGGILEIHLPRKKGYKIKIE